MISVQSAAVVESSASGFVPASPEEVAKPSQGAPKPRLSAGEVDRRLKQALAELEKAQENAVLWFAEVVRRKMYRDLGYSSIYQYAEVELGFSKSKTAQFLRLAGSFEKLPGLRESVASGELSWTKAREVAKVATPATEGSWIREAKQVPSRELERRVSEKRRQASAGVSGRVQATLEMAPGTGEGQVAEPPVPVDLHVRMTAEQYARYQALMEALGKGRVKGDKAELLLAGLEQLVLGVQRDADPRKETGDKSTANEKPVRAEKFTRVNSKSPYQVVVQMCPRCKGGTVPTSRGEKGSLTRGSPSHPLRRLCPKTRGEKQSGDSTETEESGVGAGSVPVPVGGLRAHELSCRSPSRPARGGRPKHPGEPDHPVLGVSQGRARRGLSRRDGIRPKGRSGSAAGRKRFL